jgi:hypothetical protein
VQLAKYFSGAVAILLALWVIVGEQITGASSNAVVNAQLSTIRAPIQGVVNIPFDLSNLKFKNDDVTAVITNPYVDYSFLYELVSERSSLLFAIMSHKAVLKVINTQISDTQSRIDIYLDSAIVKNNFKIARLEERIRLYNKIESAHVISKEPKLSAMSLQNSIELSRANENLEIQQNMRRSLSKKTFVGEGLAELHQLKELLIATQLYYSKELIQSESIEDQLSLMRNAFHKKQRGLITYVRQL